MDFSWDWWDIPIGILCAVAFLTAAKLAAWLDHWLRFRRMSRDQALEALLAAKEREGKSEFANYRDDYRKNFSETDWMRIAMGRNHLPFDHRLSEYDQRGVGSPMYHTTGFFVLYRVIGHLPHGESRTIIAHCMDRLYEEVIRQGDVDLFRECSAEAVERAADLFEDWRREKVRYPA